ncbi:protein pygopus-like [Diorhabda carinulata]|uniref:protein pygopus-like n=1 Tax=Diorhabda sublineata TaxID=1163346 RepID=UPI0024E1150D|nr:protein pygopus-like [Diorhabda sublineata]XP_057669288.1 protein pygopus-like [Diorhabda carinulata]
MSHMPPFRLNVPNLPSDLPPAPSNPKRKRKNAPIQPPPSVQDLLPPPLSGYGDTIVASNPFDDCPSNVNTGMSRPHGGPQMVMGGPNPNMVMANNMGMYRPMCPNPSMGMNSPIMHSPNAHQMNNSMMMNGPRMNHMGPSHGPPHMMPSPNGPGGGGPMGPNMNMTGPPMHSPIGNMGPMPGHGSGNASPMGHNGPMNGGGMNNPMNGPPMGGPQMSHGSHGGPGQGPGMNMNSGNGPPVGPPMNNNFIMSPMNNMYSKPMPVSAGKVYPADQPMVFNSQNPNAPPIYPCGVCHKEVHDNDQAILCESGCNFWFHRGCTGLTEAAFQLLTAEVYAEWVCDKCLQSKNIPLVKFKP